MPDDSTARTGRDAPGVGVAGTSATASRTPRTAVLTLISGSFPNLVQWYNLYVFAVFAPFFRTEFFDASDGGSLVYVYAIFALTFVTRPLGSWLFGRLADRRGRSTALVASVLLMSAGSAVLALSPTHAAVGGWAAVILVAVGLIQGIATGGEYGVSSVLLSETATVGRRGFFSSFQAATIVGGQVLAQAVLLVLLTVGDRSDVSEWGWRAAFGLGVVGGLVTLWWARRVHDTPPKRAGTATLADLFRRSPRQLLWVVLMTSGGTAAFYTATVTLPTIGREAAFSAGGRGAEQAATVVTFLALVVLMVLQPLAGALSDSIGRKPLLLFFGVAGLVVVGGAVLVAPTVIAPVALMMLLLVVFTVITGYLSVNTIAKTEAFPADLRALGVGFGYAVANSLFGGTAPMIYHASAGAGLDLVFALYVTVLIAVTLAACVRMRGGRTSPLDDH